MTNSNYELRIISKDSGNEGKVLKKYIIDGQETVGVVENEPFEIEFKNKTWSKICVRISVDGTDIQTGQLANTSPDGELWMVEPYGVLRLKAWPESSKGGSEFLFGKVEDSVAANTHENVSGKGIIAAAVFVEGYSPYAVFNQGMGPFGNHQLTGSNNNPVLRRRSMAANKSFGNHSGYLGTFGGGGTFGSSSISSNSLIGSSSIRSMDSISTADSIEEQDLAVGAGDYVAQEIVKVAGLTKPVLNTTISIKYENWTSLRSKVRAIQKEVVNVANPAFPGDALLETKMIDLKNTPKGRNKRVKKSRTPDLQRF